MLVFPLKKEWYEKILSGEKRVEYREAKPYWVKRLWKEGCLPDGAEWSYEEEQKKVGVNWLFPVTCTLRYGYTKRRMEAQVVKIRIVNGRNTDLHLDKPVFAIHLANVKEVED